MFVLSSADFFLDLGVFKISFRNTIRVSNSLDPDQDQCSVCPDLGTNCCKQQQKPLQADKELKISLMFHTMFLNGLNR